MDLALKAIYVFSLLTVLASTIEQKNADIQNSTESSCSLLKYIKIAHCSLTEDYLFCSRGISSEFIRSVQSSIRHLRIHEWPGKCIDLDVLQVYFPALKDLEFINCTHIEAFKGRFHSRSKIQHLKLHGLLSLWEISEGIVRDMKELRVLDLRYNGLRYMRENFLTDPPRLEQVYLSGNRWDCSDGGLDWLAMENENSTVRRRVVDYYNLVCHHQLYRGKPLHVVMDIIRVLRQTCPSPCSCVMTHVVTDVTGTVIPLITVDCAQRSLKDAPASLPPATTTLRLEGNKITTIKHIVQNPQYQKLMDLYLDNNSIQAVKELEGSEWFSTFRVLSLKGNLLKQIPVYAFDRALQGNNNIMHVFLGHNPWRCDCHFIPRFQGLLLKYKRVIRDLPDIRCSKSDDKTISLVQISTLSLGNVCANSEVEMPISTVNIVNIILFVVLLLVMGKFLYDWHKFKTTGKLPWISSILP